MRGYEEFSQELLTHINDGKTEHEKQSYAYEKIKGEQCKECSMDNYCSGIHKNYSEIYGTDELKPIKREPKELIEKCIKNTS